MIKHTSEEEIENYYSSDKLNQTSIKAILQASIAKFIMDKNNLVFEKNLLYYEENKSFILGNAVDTLITQEEAFKNKYYVSNITKKPSTNILSIITQLFESIDVNEPIPIDDLSIKAKLIEIIDLHEYGKNWLEVTKINKIVNFGTDYWNELFLSRNKTILSSEEYNIIVKVVQSIKNSSIFKNTNFESENIVLYNQLPIYFEYLEVQCKALLDRVIVNHKDKTIQAIDIKTLYNVAIDFIQSYKKYRYDIQAAFYNLALSFWKHSVGLSDYTILEFIFVAESTNFTSEKALEFKINKKAIVDATFGNGNIPELRSIREAIELYKIWEKLNFNPSQIEGVIEINEKFEYSNIKI